MPPGEAPRPIVISAPGLWRRCLGRTQPRCVGGRAASAPSTCSRGGAVREVDAAAAARGRASASDADRRPAARVSFPAKRRRAVAAPATGFDAEVRATLREVEWRVRRTAGRLGYVRASDVEPWIDRPQWANAVHAMLSRCPGDRVRQGRTLRRPDPPHMLAMLRLPSCDGTRHVFKYENARKIAVEELSEEPDLRRAEPAPSRSRGSEGGAAALVRATAQPALEMVALAGVQAQPHRPAPSGSRSRGAAAGRPPGPPGGRAGAHPARDAHGRRDAGCRRDRNARLPRQPQPRRVDPAALWRGRHTPA